MGEASVDSSIMLETTNLLPKDNDTLPPYQPIYQILDSQPIRATCFHPTGDVFVVGSNSKNLRICVYPSEEEMANLTGEMSIGEPRIAYKFVRTHRGSIYCANFNNKGNLLATGSNDQTVRIIRYNSEKRLPEGSEYMLTMHSGTIRDLCFLQDGSEKGSSFLASGGAGDYEIFVTDCETMKPIRTLVGHESNVMSLNSLGNTTTLYSASLDGTIRCWDVRSKICGKIISTNRPGGDAISTTNKGTPVGVVRVEETGKLLVSGHTDGRCMLYDIRGARVVQLFQAHEDEIRTVNFSPKSYYLMTASYDRKVKLMDLQGDLTRKLPCVEIAELDDKVVQTAWHPDDYTFVTTCADGSATLWAMPGFDKTDPL